MGLSMLLRGTEAEWARFEFDVFDSDHSGVLSREQFSRYVQSTSPGMNAAAAAQVAEETFDSLDVDRSGTLSFEVRLLLNAHPPGLERGTDPHLHSRNSSRVS